MTVCKVKLVVIMNQSNLRKHYQSFKSSLLFGALFYVIDTGSKKEIDSVGEKKVDLGSLLDYSQELFCLFVSNFCAKVETT